MPHQCTNCERTFADGSKEMLSGCPECGGNKFQFRPEGRDSSGSTAGDGGTTSTGQLAEEPPEPADRPGDSVAGTVGSAAATVRDLVGGSASPDATDARPPEDSDATTPRTAGAESAPSRTETGGSAPGSADDSDIIVAESDPTAVGEDTAQADARSAVVEPDEVTDSGEFDPLAGGSDSPPSDSSPDERAPGEAAERSDGVADAMGPADGAVDSEPATAAEPDKAAADEPDRTVADEPDAERADRPDLSELREELNDQFESIRVVEPGQYELNLMELYDREEYIVALQEDGKYTIQVPDRWSE